MDPKVLIPEGFLIHPGSSINRMSDNLIHVVKGELEYFMLVDSMSVKFQQTF